ncbi:MAG: pentapeptide repeat-containing protein [Cyanosarcina radialis HA8281-LM2]|jgi:uncharacterized protein YjbI with pentapeptide repeats|nr:pentapeptide repeat-containing protein [Cyanosarcina radialis HA8281-LM2]
MKFPNSSDKKFPGVDFNGQNLTGKDFSKSDIRGANFTNAILENANFQGAIAGVRPEKVVFLLVVLLVLFGVAGGASGFGSIILTGMFQPEYIARFNLIPGVVSLFAISLFFQITIRRGFGEDLAIATGILIGIIAAILFGYVGWISGFSGIAIASRTGWELLAAGTWTFAGFTLGAIILVTARLLGGSTNSIFWIAWTIGAILSANASLSLKNEPINWYACWLLNSIALVFLGIICGYISWQATANNKKFLVIYKLAVNISVIGGTSFRGANLTGANFEGAILKSTDFTNANLTRTNFYLTQKLDRSRFKNTILTNPKVRKLLVDKNGIGRSYQGCNLRGANLDGAKLNQANLTKADISHATLVRADLEDTNLCELQAINTNFQQAQLTGACLEAWNIDSTTRLDGVICEYVYLLNNQQERRPSSGKFAPGDFTKLFQVAINTVDLIFRNGLDLQALTVALAKVKLENEGIPLAIKSIENKGDGIVSVRVDVPESANKTKIHAEVTQKYEFILQQLKSKYQAKLESKDEQIAILKDIIQTIAPTPRTSTHNKLAILKLGQGDFRIGFPVILQIGLEGKPPDFEFNGKLPPASELALAYDRWQAAYRQSLQGNLRIEFPETQVTNISKPELSAECQLLADNLKNHINLWLNSELFRPVKEQLLARLNLSESIRIIWQTEDSQLRRIPLQLWDFFERYPQAEIALSSPTYEKKEKSRSSRSDIKILAILGDSTGIDTQKDRILLENLPKAKVKFLVEPQRQALNDELWQQSWHILFFAGHSFTRRDREIGHFCINQTDSLTIAELRNALTKAIERGLQLAIFNSCDGLGLATNLADLHIPQTIVMREPVPDKVAQEFLKNLLAEFSSGKPLYQSVREARLKLQGLENEFPCASWLPVICQNPAEIPLTWS